jgi:hypothetical protein
MPNPGPFTYWYLQAPSLLLLALIVLLVVRLLLIPLGLLEWGPLRLVRAITQPVVAAIGGITPRIVSPVGVIVCAIIWLATARVLLLMAGLALGARM